MAVRGPEMGSMEQESQRGLPLWMLLVWTWRSLTQGCRPPQPLQTADPSAPLPSPVPLPPLLPRSHQLMSSVEIEVPPLRLQEIGDRSAQLVPLICQLLLNQTMRLHMLNPPSYQPLSLHLSLPFWSLIQAPLVVDIAPLHYPFVSERHRE